MATSWEEIETRSMTYIKNDRSLEWDMINRPAVFYNRMKAYMTEAIPRFNRPPEMLMKLEKFTEPEFDDVMYTQETAVSEGSSIVIQTDITGFDLCSSGVITQDDYGGISYVPLTSVYDSGSGSVTMSGPIAAGTEIALDFYKSGSFAFDLNGTEKGILACAIYNAWEHRFDNDVLERQSKIRDSGFTTISEASQINANTSRQKESDTLLYGMMRAYQDNAEYLRLVKGIKGIL